VRVKRRDLVDLSHRQLHFGGERRHVRSGDVAVFVLDQMQMLDQQITLPRPLAKQRSDFSSRGRIDLTALGGAARLAAARRRAVSIRRQRILNIHGRELNSSRLADNPVPPMD
jgi:hypothetical protein